MTPTDGALDGLLLALGRLPIHSSSSSSSSSSKAAALCSSLKICRRTFDVNIRGGANWWSSLHLAGKP